MSDIKHYNSPTKKEEWTKTVGALAWTPHPNRKTVQNQPWPCLIYPSWSIAILYSGLFPNYHHRQHDARKNNRGRGGDGADGDSDSHSSVSRGSAVGKTLAILSCKKRVKLSDLASNRVPLRVALNPGKDKRRSKVVVHFLGVNEWCVASIGDLTQYSAETALAFIRRSRNNRHSGDDDDSNFSPVRVGQTNIKKRKNGDMNDWLLAIKEASIACERADSLDPSLLLFQCEENDGTVNNASKPSSCEGTAAIISSTARKMTNVSNNKIMSKPQVQVGEQRAPMPILKIPSEKMKPYTIKSCDDNDSITRSATHKMTNTSNNKTMAKPKVETGEQREPMQLSVYPAEERKELENAVKTECTPECFDDWRMGGNTEKLLGSSQSQFLLVSQGKTQ